MNNTGWRLRNRSKEKSKDVLVIGIDFGTTYSGVAWATAADFEKESINVISTWPGSGREEGKAPTEVSYDGDQVLWGYDIPTHASRIQWFKLLLLETEDLSLEMQTSPLIQSARDRLRNSGKTAVDATADYLGLLWRHVLSVLEKSLGSSVKALSFHVVLTVPAIWKDYARRKMEIAAQKAGILGRRLAGPTRLSLVPEPEAASLSTLLDRHDTIEAGEVFVVCDAGGGTVDLITYEIESSDPVRMHEAVEGAGGLCGGVFIDEAFEQLCRTRLGQAWQSLTRAGKNEMLKGDWEFSIKRHFSLGNTQKEYIVSLPTEMFRERGTRSLDDTTREPVIKLGRIHFKENHIRDTFTKVFVDISKLINAQIRKATEQDRLVTGLILVGGLGGNPYLYDYMKEWLAREDIEVLQPSGMKARTAICTGAVCKGFLDDVDGIWQSQSQKPIDITSTICRINVGIVIEEFFNAAKHREEDRIWNDTEGVWKAKHQMKWYLKKGECVSKDDQIDNSYYNIFETDWDGTFNMDMYQCDDLVPPVRWTTSMSQLCSFQCSLGDSIPVSSLANHMTPKGKRMKRIDFDMRMTPSGRSVDFNVEVNGIRLGQTNVDKKLLTSNAAGISLSLRALQI